MPIYTHPLVDRLRSLGIILGREAAARIEELETELHTEQLAYIGASERAARTKTELDAANRYIKSIATMLGWEIVPPQRIMEIDIAALKVLARGQTEQSLNQTEHPRSSISAAESLDGPIG
jgi:hypothetical protein